jgi:hypothetical protein
MVLRRPSELAAVTGEVKSSCLPISPVLGSVEIEARS